MSSRRLPPLNALKVFEAYGRLLNMKIAAEELCVTQSAVSRQLKLIEDYLGSRLFEKVGRKNQLTEQGEEYLKIISIHLAEISKATNLMFPKEVPPSQSKKLVIGSYPVFAEYWLIPRLKDFTEKHPDIEIEIHINNQRDIYLPLENVDIEIFLGLPDPDKFEVTKLHLIHDFPVCSTGFLESYDRDVQKTMFEGAKIHEASYHWWPRWIKSVNLEGDISNAGPLIFDECLTIKLGCLGHGLVIGDHLSSTDLILQEKLLRPIQEIAQTDDWVSLICRQQTYGSLHIKYFNEWIIGEMNKFNNSLRDYNTP